MKLKSPEEIEDFFEVAETAELIRQRGFKAVGLQVPDELLLYSHGLVGCLKRRLRSEGTKIVVLGDTSFGASGDSNEAAGEISRTTCCIDEITAMHSNCDLIVHYGFHCFSGNERISSLIVPTRQQIHKTGLEACISQIQRFFVTSKIPIENPIPLFTDIRYFNTLKTILVNLKKISDQANFYIPPHQDLFFDINQPEITVQLNTISGQRNMHPISKFIFNDESIELTTFLSDDMIEISKLALALSSRPFLLLVINPVSLKIQVFSDMDDLAKRLMAFDSTLFETPSIAVDKLIRYQYGKIEKAKGHIEKGKVFGIVMGSVTAKWAIKASQYVKALLQDREIPFYSFFVGKITPQKLANFTNIDIFVLISCPYNSFLPMSLHSQFAKPIITPNELEIALDIKQWNGNVKFDLDNLDIDEIILQTRDTKPKPKSKPIVIQYEQDSTEIVHVKDSQRQIGALFQSSAADFLKEVTFRGLDFTSQEEPHAAIPGRDGIASGLSYLDSDTKDKI